MSSKSYSSAFVSMRHTEGFLFGTAAASTFFLICLVLLDSKFQPFFLNKLLEFAAIPVALWVAFAGWRAVSKQVENDREMEMIRQRSSLEAEKASLAPVLSELSDVCRAAIVLTLQEPRGDADALKKIGMFGISDRALSVLKGCISYADSDTGDRLANIIRHFQVALSRTLSSYEDPKVGIAPYRNTLDWAVVQLLVDDCFEFARGKSQRIPKTISKGSLYSAISLISVVNVEDFDGLSDEITRRSKSGRLEFF